MASEKGMTRSCYGVQHYSPEEIKQQWREFMRVRLRLTVFSLLETQNLRLMHINLPNNHVNRGAMNLK